MDWLATPVTKKNVRLIKVKEYKTEDFKKYIIEIFKNIVKLKQ